MLMTEKLEPLLVLNRAFQHIYRALSLDFDELLQACSFKFDLVYPLEGTNLIVVKQRDRVPGYIYVSDLSQFLYCPRRFYLTYRVVNIVDKIKLAKIRSKLQELKPELRDGALLYDIETFRRILVGIYLHRCVENTFKFLNLPRSYEVEKEVVDEDLGLIGHVDLVHVRYLSQEEYEKCILKYSEEYCEKPRATVYEVKSGLYREVPESYKRQAQLYAYLLEKREGYIVEKVYVAHPVHPSDITSGIYFKLVKIEYDREKTGRELLELIRTARRVLREREPPRVFVSRDKCEKCAYKLICLY